MKHFKIVWLLLLIFFSPLAFTQKITLAKTDAIKDKYHVALIKFLLADEEDVEFDVYPKSISYSRQINEIENGNLSIAAFGTSESLEKQLLPIRIPILKGLLGHRIFIIRQGDQARFDHIDSFSELKKFKAGQGRTWADTQILKGAGIPTVTSVKYKNLFHMLDGSRFDYFPRAVHEPFAEIASNSDLPLALEQNIMLVYPLAMYLFVSPDNQALADLILTNFEEKIADGSFDQFFFEYPLIQDVLNKVNVKQRKVIRISNNTLSSETPLDREELWFSVDQM
ncbi:diguanylate cyclase [Catenovulum maritimum]|uniref:Diguanylate cyclase n=1 Tax=Catenovulum maritimum TaxID=1513271 RepID=A0A0J8GR98_9ALTE|nr:diguanylate cyclase [Catenovulum maritimum]KMT63754.1 diguanylate cyclase [Catenovulum maritimum]